jgi:DnaJ-class molecular chaperone
MSDAFPNHYAALGLDRRCTTAQVRSAYRLLAKKHHPDLAGSSAEAADRTRELNAAHEVLSDATRRRAYDRDLAAHLGEANTEPRVRIERNIALDVRVRIEELLHGASLQVRVKDPANLGGEECYDLSLPPDTAPGARFRLPRVEPFEGGFVQIRIRVLPSGRFKVNGSDLRCDLRISSGRAAHGGAEMVPGPAGGVLRVPIAAGIARGAVIRLTGEGLPKSRGGRGDLLVRVIYRPEVKITRTRSR